MFAQSIFHRHLYSRWYSYHTYTFRSKLHVLLTKKPNPRYAEGSLEFATTSYNYICVQFHQLRRRRRTDTSYTSYFNDLHVGLMRPGSESKPSAYVAKIYQLFLLSIFLYKSIFKCLWGYVNYEDYMFVSSYGVMFRWLTDLQWD